MNIHQANLLLEAKHGIFDLRASFINCPLIWDTGALYGRLLCSLGSWSRQSRTPTHYVGEVSSLGWVFCEVEDRGDLFGLPAAIHPKAGLASDTPSSPPAEP